MRERKNIINPDRSGPSVIHSQITKKEGSSYEPRYLVQTTSQPPIRGRRGPPHLCVSFLVFPLRLPPPSVRVQSGPLPSFWCAVLLMFKCQSSQMNPALAGPSQRFFSCSDSGSSPRLELPYLSAVECARSRQVRCPDPTLQSSQGRQGNSTPGPTLCSRSFPLTNGDMRASGTTAAPLGRHRRRRRCPPT